MIFIIIAAIVCMVGIFGGAWSARRFLKKISEDAEDQSLFQSSIQNILQGAQDKRGTILNAAKQAAKAQYTEEEQQLEAERETLRCLQEQEETLLSQRQSELDKRANALDVHLLSVEELEKTNQKNLEQAQNLGDENELCIQNLQNHWQIRSGITAEQLFTNAREEWVAAERLGIDKWLAEHQEKLKAEAQQFAGRVCDVVNSRYQPAFIWPKTSFSVGVDDFQWFQKYILEEGAPVTQLLLQGTDCSFDLLEVPSHDQDPTRFIKITGGLGMDKEAIRLTLQEIRDRRVSSTDRIRVVLEKHKKYLERLAIKMGEDALHVLGFKSSSTDPVLLRLIGCLNYRTSHRQNQYHHSLEVAQLAVLIANEIGVDRNIAAKAGILHDIGKVLDYKIEGSHAVISGDYATRHGESPVIVDTVLAHHDDKVVETPYAYILKAADALSGARPGARVDMEEGYHRRIDGISGVVNSFKENGVTGSAIMHAGREVHVFVDSQKMKPQNMDELARNIVAQLEKNVEYPGQIRVTVIRRTEAVEVA